MSDVLTQLRDACATVAQRARYVRIDVEAIPAYAASLPLGHTPPTRALSPPESREQLAACWLTLDAINFGSGWFPTLRKPGGQSGYQTIARGLADRFASRGPWRADELIAMTPAEIAQALGQDPDHELMQLFARSLADLGRHVASDFAGRFAAVVDAADGSALALVETLARWESFDDVLTYDGLTIPFLKRAQIATADLARTGVAQLTGLDRLTMFADNLVPHVLRLDGILAFDHVLVDRIQREQRIEHGSREEVEIRACAVHAVELIVAHRAGTRAADVDQLLWQRGQQPHYKAVPRHRARSTAY